jgi:hypothetical protein
MKGIAFVLIVFGIALLAETLIFSFAIVENISRTRHSTEYKVLFEGDELETYVHSFLRSTDLSLIQSVYDVGKNNVIYDYSLNYYEDGIPYWQIYQQSFVPSYDTFQKEISSISHSYINDYIDAFKSYASESDYSIKITKISSNPMTEIGDGKITISTQAENQVQFTRSTKIGNKDLAIERSIPADSSLSINFKSIVELAKQIIDDNLIYNTIEGESDQNSAQEKLDNLAASLSDDTILVNFTVVDYQNAVNNFKAIVLVEISDKANNYSIYSYSQDQVISDRLGVKFYSKVGTLVDNNDQYSPQELNNFSDCVTGEIGVISSRSPEIICKSLTNFS